MGQPVGQPGLVRAELTFRLAEDILVFCCAMAGLAAVHLALLAFRRWNQRSGKSTVASWSFAFALSSVSTWAWAAAVMLWAQ